MSNAVSPVGEHGYLGCFFLCSRHLWISSSIYELFYFKHLKHRYFLVVVCSLINHIIYIYVQLYKHLLSSTIIDLNNTLLFSQNSQSYKLSLKPMRGISLACPFSATLHACVEMLTLADSPSRKLERLTPFNRRHWH